LRITFYVCKRSVAAKMSAMPSETPATFDMIKNSSVFLEIRSDPGLQIQLWNSPRCFFDAMFPDGRRLRQLLIISR
jgi:hypothetical protein